MIFVDIVDLSDYLDDVYDQMADHGETHLVFHADNETVGQEALDILSVVPGIKATLFMTGRAKIREQHDCPPWLNEAVWSRVAGRIQQKLQVRTGWMLYIGHDGTHMRKPQHTTVIDLKKRKENSVALRLVMDKKYCQNWNTKHASAQARSWCCAQSNFPKTLSRTLGASNCWTMHT